METIMLVVIDSIIFKIQLIIFFQAPKLKSQT